MISYLIETCIILLVIIYIFKQELQAHYDEGQRQLAVTLDQLAIAQRKIQSLTGEMEELRGNYDAVSLKHSIQPKIFRIICTTKVQSFNLYLFQTLRNKRAIEIMYEESQSRVNELTTINVNLSSSRSKIEQELHQLVSDYEEVSKELRVSFTFLLS